MSYLCQYHNMEKSSLTIYRASAGSGKTFTLTVEYIYLMIHPDSEDEYQHTLAVTFTNKATAEMKDRIIQQLYGIWKALPSSESYVGALQQKLAENEVEMNVQAIRTRCGDALRKILHDYTRFRIETIDSFFQSVLRTLARELGQTPNLQVNLNDNELVAQAVDRIIENLHEDPRLQKVVMEYINSCIDDSGKWDIRKNIKEFAKCIFEEEFCNKSDQQREMLSNAETVGEFQRQMRSIKNNAARQLKESAQKILDAYNSSNIAEMLRWKTPFTYLQKIIDGETPEKSSSLEKFIQDPAYILLKKHASKADVVEQLTTLAEMFGKYYELDRSVTESLNTAALAEKFTFPLQLLERIDQEVRSINEENSSFSLSKTPTLLSRLIQDNDSPFVFEKIGTVLRNIMIDEFQDTSQLQWNNFRVLLFENQAQGGSDLVVGDIKQSIYRWRGGYWALLKNLAETMRIWDPKEKILETNFRSEVEIIDFNNRLYPEATRQLDALNPEARFRISDIYEDVQQQWPKNKERHGYVRTALIMTGTGYPKENKDIANDWMLEEMLKRIIYLHDQGLPLENMAILVRKNKYIPVILEYFKEHAPEEISITSDEAFLLENSPLISFLITTMRMLVTDITQNPIPAREFIYTYYRDIENCNIATDQLLRGDITELLPEFLVDNRQSLIEKPIYELFETLYSHLRLERMEGQEAYLFAFIDILQNHLKSNTCDIHSFLKLWDENYHRTAIPAGRVEGVRILSIHKSKGLEFHTVFMPFCNWSIEADRNDQILWCQAHDGHDEFNVLGDLPISRNKKMAESYYREDYIEEHLQNRVDELNALYVGTTRAGKNLYIWGSARDSFSQSSTIGDLLKVSLGVQKGDVSADGYYTEEWGSPVTRAKEEENSDNRMKPDYQGIDINVRSYEARLNFRQSNDSLNYLAERKAVSNQPRTEKTKLGTLYHDIFSRIRDIDDADRVLDDCKSQGIIDTEQYLALRDFIEEIRKNPVVSSWFAKGNIVFNECSILNPKGTNHEDKNLRPDRVIMQGDTITVIDYKFGNAHNEYLQQVRGYMNIIHEMYPEREIQGFIWYVTRGKITQISL